MVNDAAAHAERLAWEMATWRSVEMRVRVTYQRNEVAPNGDLAFTEVDQHTIETQAGQRVFHERMLMHNGKRLIQTSYRDGERFAASHEDEVAGQAFSAVEILNAYPREGVNRLSNRPAPLQFFYSALEPLPRSLARAESLGEARVSGRECDSFLVKVGDARTKDGLLSTYCLDRATSLPMEVRVYADESSYAARQPLAVWTARALKDVEGHLFPMDSILSSYSRGSDSPVVVRDLHVEELHFNREYPQTTFWPKIGPETQVVDMVSGKSHPSSLAADLSRQATQATARQPIEATDSRVVWDYWPVLAVGLGLALVVGGLVLRRRRG